MKYLSLALVALLAVATLSLSLGESNQSIFVEAAGPDLPASQAVPTE